MARETRQIDIERAAAQLAEAVKLGRGREGWASFTLPRLRDARFVECPQSERFDPEVVTVAMPRNLAAHDEGLFRECRAVLAAALEVHAAAREVVGEQMAA